MEGVQFYTDVYTIFYIWMGNQIWVNVNVHQITLRIYKNDQIGLLGVMNWYNNWKYYTDINLYYTAILQKYIIRHLSAYIWSVLCECLLVIMKF